MDGRLTSGQTIPGFSGNVVSPAAVRRGGHTARDGNGGTTIARGIRFHTHSVFSDQVTIRHFPVRSRINISLERAQGSHPGTPGASWRGWMIRKQ